MSSMSEQNRTTVRSMSWEDLARVACLEAQIFSCPWSEQGFRDALSMEQAVFLVAARQEEVLGYCGMYCAADEGEITNVAVAPPFRRQGVGGQMMGRMLAISRERGICRVILEVRVSNREAIRFYRKWGFAVEGRRKGFYQLPQEDGYVMVKSNSNSHYP